MGEDYFGAWLDCLLLLGCSGIYVIAQYLFDSLFEVYLRRLVCGNHSGQFDNI